MKNKLTQKELAEKIGISELTYQRYELSKRSPNVYSAIKIANTLNTKVEDLFPVSPQQK